MPHRTRSLRFFIILSMFLYTLLGSVIVLTQAQNNTGNWDVLDDSSGSPDHRHESGFIEVGGLMYLIGGRSDRDTNIYDPIADAWTDGANPPVEMHHIQPVAIDGLIYVVAAYSGQCCDSEFGLSHIYIYDPLADAWHLGAEIPANRRRGSVGAVVYNDEIYIVGGLEGGHGNSATSFAYFDKYNPTTNEWTILEDAPRARDHFNAVLMGDEMYLAGGRQTDVGSFFENTVAEVDVFNFTTNTWSTLPSGSNIPTERAGTLAASIADEVIVVGGESNQNDAHDETEALNINTEAWRSLDSLNEDRHSGGMAECNGTLYAVSGSGGKGGGPELSSAEIFSFDGPTVCPRNPYTASTLVADSAPLDFGTVIEDTSTTRSLSLENTAGDQAILITDIDLNEDDEFSLSLPYSLPVVIAPNSVLTIDISFTPDNQNNYTDTLRVEHSAGSDLTINVLGSGGDADSAPMIAPIDNQVMQETTSLTVEVAVADDDPVTLGYQVWDVDGLAASAPFYTTVDNGNGTGAITFSPALGDSANSPYDVTVSALDSAGNLSTETFVLTVGAQQAPVFDLIEPINLAATATLIVPISATDLEGDAISLSMTSDLSFASFIDNEDGTGQLTLSPAHGAQGTYSLSLEASDAYGSNSVDVAITVVPNQKPVFDSIPDQTVPLGEVRIITVNAIDPEGMDVGYRIIGVGRLPSFMVWDGVDTLTIDPTLDDLGTYTVTVAASDGFTQRWERFVITVALNTKPVFETIGSQVVPYTEVRRILADATDPEGSPLTYRVIQANLLPDFVTWNGRDTLIIDPDVADVGTTFDVIFEANDGIQRRWERFDVTIVEPNELAAVNFADYGYDVSRADVDIPVVSVQLNPEDDLQAVIDLYPEGTAFVFTPGVYRMQTITPKNGQEFYGQPDAVLSGAALLTDFVREGKYWVATGQTQELWTHGLCRETAPRCHRPEQLFFDDVPLHHVGSLDDVVLGTWYFDYDTDRIYMVDNPTGHTVETSIVPYAFVGTASDVLISNLTIEKFASPAQHGAIDGDFSINWIVQNNIVRLNHGRGIRLGHGMQVINNIISDNGQMGVGGEGDNVLVEWNDIARNNFAGFDDTWEAGGTKFARTDGLIVRHNYVYENFGPGLWTDIDNINSVYDTNLVMNNESMGIFHEISYDVVIMNNVSMFNAMTNYPWLYGAQIIISSSRNADIFDNRVVVSQGGGNGITLLQQNRGIGVYGDYLTQNNDVYNNTVVHLGVFGINGIGADWEQDSFYSQGDNSFDNNSYYVPQADVPYWVQNGLWTWEQFQALGQEANGKIFYD